MAHAETAAVEVVRARELARDHRRKAKRQGLYAALFVFPFSFLIFLTPVFWASRRKHLRAAKDYEQAAERAEQAMAERQTVAAAGSGGAAFSNGGGSNYSAGGNGTEEAEGTGLYSGESGAGRAEQATTDGE